MKNILILSLVIFFGGCVATYNKKKAVKIVDNKFMKKSYKKYLDNNSHKYKALALAYSGDSIKGSATWIGGYSDISEKLAIKTALKQCNKRRGFLFTKCKIYDIGGVIKD